MRNILAPGILGVLILTFTGSLVAQSLGNAGTIQGTVVDPSGAAIADAEVTVHNPVANYSQSATTDASGAFRLINIPPNSYHLDIKAAHFVVYSQDVAIRHAVPVEIKATLQLAGEKTSVTVEASGADLLEVTSSDHTDANRSLIDKLPDFDPGAGLSQAITYTTGGVAADANGFFHPMGDHAEVSFVIDGQPISDQQSKVFSTQLPTGAVESMQLTTGSPDAEFGDKTSLVAQITTRSGLGAKGVFGNFDAQYGSFGTASASAGVGFGSQKIGNFLSMEAARSGRFLDSPEFTPFHDIGNHESIFDRLDYQPDTREIFHLNLFLARNWIQIPNDYDQLSQDQRQRVATWSIAPGYQRTLNPHALLTVNPYIRKDEFFYYPSRDLFNDTPATQSQARQLLNWGVKSDVAITSGRHNIKVGVDLKQTRLLENFAFGITDPAFNPICVDADGNAAGPLALTNPNGCASLGFSPNPNLQPGLVPFDLTRGGSRFAFHDAANIDQYAAYAQDEITAGRFLFTLGFRYDRYNGLTDHNGAEPHAGIAYNVKQTGTVLRVAYARTFETPFNENLLLSSATGTGGLAANVFGSASLSIAPGRRNQFNTGFQQAIGRFLQFDGDYFWKYTLGAYDFSTLLNTTITFPISWHNSKLDGFTGRLSTTNLHGFQAYWTFGHTRARFFPPEVGGLVPQGTPLAPGVFRIDHDQALQSTGVFRYQHKQAEWIAFTWRYDSGMAVSGVPDVASALTLTAAQQTTIGFACDGVPATLTTPITSCSGAGTSTLLTLPQTGRENDDHNPDRVEPRNVFDMAIGSDNLFHSESRRHFTASINIANLTNRVALYNFLSTFSGTHFLQPRTLLARVGFVF
jgi:hypothetical protein